MTTERVKQIIKEQLEEYLKQVETHKQRMKKNHIDEFTAYQLHLSVSYLIDMEARATALQLILKDIEKEELNETKK